MPHPLTAREETGFLCNTDMSNADVLLTCYRYGIFPWSSYFHYGSFYFPPKRYVIEPSKIKIQKSMRPYFNQGKFQITMDKCFREVMALCKSVRRNNDGSTWISGVFEKVYGTLHDNGYAHSVEVWKDGNLVGGLYGVAVGKIFTGESMFSLMPNASKYAMISLAKFLETNGFNYIDCQVYNNYLSSFGGVEIDSRDFFYIMKNNLKEEDNLNIWK